jgi:N-acetylornithine carbamoyltransferase
MSPKILDLSALDDATLARALSRAAALARDPASGRALLAGRTVGLVFMNPSVRTLASMQAATSQLGGASFVVSPGSGSWKFETRDGVVMDGEAAEHVREAIPVLAQYCDVLGVRCFAEQQDLAADLSDAVMTRIAERCPKPFLNLESAASHPCQSLADLLTLDDLEIPRGGTFVLSWAYHPKPLPYAVPASTLTMAARRGMDVRVVRPEGYALPAALTSAARALAARSGGRITETSDRRAGFDGAHVAYVKSWAAADCYGAPAKDLARRASLQDWCVDEPWFSPARPDAKFMHCLPVRRNVKVADAVLDGPRSVVVRQAANRLHAQKALLLELLSAGDALPASTPSLAGERT